MAPPAARVPLRVLFGCTAVGKSDVALEWADAAGAEIICVDSMQVYRGMDIGTAKPTAEMRRRVPHHLLDIIDPADTMTAARFAEQADSCISQIAERGRVPLLVVGTPFYLMAILYGLFDGPAADADFRAELRARAQCEGVSALHAELARVDAAAAARIHANDMHRIERALEVHRQTGRPISELQRQWTGPARYDFSCIGLRRDRADLATRINTRVRTMVTQGLVDEVRALLNAPAGLSEAAGAALGYAEIVSHLRGECPLDEAIERIKINTRRFAKSQRTWFRRFRDTRWLDIRPDECPATTARRLDELDDASEPSDARTGL